MPMMTLPAGASLTDRDLRAIIALVYEKSGITLHDGKRELVATRCLGGYENILI